jgi:hypothetical protein
VRRGQDNLRCYLFVQGLIQTVIYDSASIIYYKVPLVESTPSTRSETLVAAEKALAADLKTASIM